MCSKARILFYLVVLKESITGVLVPTLDMFTDLATAVTHFIWGDWGWGEQETKPRGINQINSSRVCSRYLDARVCLAARACGGLSDCYQGVEEGVHVSEDHQLPASRRSTSVPLSNYPSYGVSLLEQKNSRFKDSRRIVYFSK